jgi:poly-beta-hydroxyalkanoate depolymerase
VFLIVYFVLQLHFRLPEEGNHQAHTPEVFNATAQNIMKDTILYAHIQANNTYYKEVLGQKMNKKLASSHIYFTEEQYNQVKVSKSFYIQCLILVFT